jgi:hypothetical protein
MCKISQLKSFELGYPLIDDHMRAQPASWVSCPTNSFKIKET